MRSACELAILPDGTLREQKDVLADVKIRHAGEAVDAWVLHCAVQEAFAIHKRLREAASKKRLREAKNIKDPLKREAFLAEPLRYDPPVFGGRKLLERRSKGLIDRETYRRQRLLPMKSLGDKNYGGNRHFVLSADASGCRFRMLTTTTKRQVWHEDKETGDRNRRMAKTYAHTEVELYLPKMRGNAGRILIQVAELGAGKKINVTFSVSATHLCVTFDPKDLPQHPERRTQFRALPGRVTALDLNPQRIGIATVENMKDPEDLDLCRLLDWALVDMTDCDGANRMVVRETMAGVCDRVLSHCASNRSGTIVVETGLGKLRSAGPNRRYNQLINGWSRTLLVQMLKRKANLRGIRVVEVWAGYSTTIGNVAFELPDACAAAAEVARRALALDPQEKVRKRSRWAKSTPEEKAEREAAKAAKESGASKRKPEEKKEALPKFDPQRAEPAPGRSGEQDAATPRLPSARLGALVRILLDLEEGGDGDRRKERRGAGSEDSKSKENRIEDWPELHRRTKAAQIGVRRPHPEAVPVKDHGSAVHRLGHRGRGGTLFRRPAVPKAMETVVARGATDGPAVNPI